MSYKKKMLNKTMFDTSKEAWADIGIYVTDEQYERLRDINLLMATEENYIPVHHIMLVLKTLGLLPTETVNEVGDEKRDENLQNDAEDSFEKRYGKIKEYY